MTKTNGGRRGKLSAKDRALALLGSSTELVARDTRDRGQLEVLIRALQGFKDGTLIHVYTRPTKLVDQATRHQLFSERFEDLAFLAPRLQKYLKKRGIRYVGEVYYAFFDPRSAAAVRYGEEIFGALQTYLRLPREIDPLLDGWTPAYWTSNFRATLSAPVIDVLGDQPSDHGQGRWYRKGTSYTSEARWIHKGGDHYIGTWLRNLRAAPSGEQGNPTNAWGVGQLEDLQSTLRHVQNLWAAALVPPDWQAPEGVPEVWTRLLEQEILPAIRAEEERRRLAEERQRTFARWRELNRRALMAFRRGETTTLTPEQTNQLNRPVADFLTTLWTNWNSQTGVEAVGHLEALGLYTIGQLIQLTDEEISYLIQQVQQDKDWSGYWWRREYISWLMDNGGLLSPVILSEDLRDKYPLPEGVLIRREGVKAAMARTQTQADQFVTTHFDALRGRVDDIEFSVRTANCLQNLGVDYIWQLCQWTDSGLLKTKNFGRKNLNEVREILDELGLKLGMTFSPEAIDLLKSR